MGWNTIVVFYNDQMNEIEKAMPRLGRAIRGAASARGDRDFGSGQVISTDHADSAQVIVAGQNSGRRVSPMHEAEVGDLEALALVLRAHGYGVRGPDEKRVRPPLGWGYAHRYWVGMRAQAKDLPSPPPSDVV